MPALPGSDTARRVPEYVIHDFGLLNRHVNETYERVRRLTRLRGANVFGRYAFFASMLIGAVAVSLVLVAFAYWLALAPPRPETRIVEIEKPVIVEKEVIVRIPVPQERGFDLPQIPASPIGQPQGAVPSNPVVTEFVLFRTAHFEEGGITAIVTGAKFASSQDSRPYHQYCYVVVSPRGLVLKHVHIAEKNVGEDARFYDVNRSLANEAGATLTVLRRAQAMCQFL